MATIIDPAAAPENLLAAEFDKEHATIRKVALPAATA
jgi:hypothetical protein